MHLFGGSQPNTSVDDRPTWPPPGVARLQIRQESELLFISAIWVIKASVDGIVLYESESASKAFLPGAIRQWARACIRSKYEKFRQLGVDAEAEYQAWGGKVDDLYRTF